MSDKQLDSQRDDPQRTPDGELPDALRWQLRALRRDAPLERDLWSGIAARLGEQAQPGSDSAASESARMQAASIADTLVDTASVGAAPFEAAPFEAASFEATPHGTASFQAPPAPQVTVLRPRESARKRWFTPMALAASVAVLALALGLVWKGSSSSLRDPAPGVLAAAQPAPSLVQREADGMTRQYQAALLEIEPVSQQAVALKPAFDELDRNTALILDAMAHDPDSRLLLEQLRRTYARRLALAQRVAYT